MLTHGLLDLVRDQQPSFPPTAWPYWPAEPVPAALALIANEWSLTAMALFLAGTIAVEAGVSAACSGGGRPRHA